MEIKTEEKLKEKILNTLDPDLLTKPFICRGKDMLFKNYLLEEVFPYLDLKSETISLKEGYVLTLKEFLEQSVFYTCQNRYKGNFIDFAQDVLISFDDKKYKEKMKKEGKRFGENDEISRFSENAKKYPFFENIEGPIYYIVIDRGEIYFYYKDSKFDLVMHTDNDIKEFLLRIKGLDFDLFKKLYEINPVFKDRIDMFKEDKEFYEKVLKGLRTMSSFDLAIESTIEEITGMIDQVESEPFCSGKVKTVRKDFDLDSIPKFDTDTCLKTVISKCTSYYSEFFNDIDQVFIDNSINEKAEYIIDEILSKTIDKLSYDYVSGIANSVNNDLELDINEDFLNCELDSVMDSLRVNLKKLFIYPYRNKEADSSESYISIICEAIENQILFYEQLVNSTIERMLVAYGYVLKGSEDTQKTTEFKPAL